MPNDESWRYALDDSGVAWLTLDRPGSSANSLSREVLEELGQRLARLEADRPRGLVIRSGKASGFIAGADIKEFLGFQSPERAYEQIRLAQGIFQRLEDLPCPSVALIRGFALGGGLELALACRYRLGIDDGKLSLGLPEVKLGIHPGFGGTVRAVRLLGVRLAMDLMLTGRSLDGRRALSSGLVDRLCAPEQAEAAARELLQAAPALRRPPLFERLLSWPGVRAFLAPALRRQVARRARADHYPAPYAMIDLWQRHGARGAAAYEAEAHSITRLFSTPTAHNLIRLFLLQDQLKALAGRSQAAPVRRLHVIGAGVMGGDIAAWCALRGMDVTLQDRELRFIEPALKRAEALYAKRIARPDARAAARARLRADVAGDGLADADVVIEAIFEDLSAKQQLFADAETRAPASALLASNTSSLTLEHIAESMREPSRLVGLHFFNPVAQMPLVEVVHTSHSHPAAMDTALAFVKRIDKLPLPCASGPGFLVNRVLFPYLFEALHAAGEGVALALIDDCAVDFGMPMGPVELADVVGLDVTLHVGEIISRDLQRELPPFMQQVRTRVAARQLGRKSGQGFYSWIEGKVAKPPADGSAPADLSDRLILAMVNECVACLRLGVVASEEHLDAGVVFGTGFAPFRGGPIAYLRARGVRATLDRLQELQQRYGTRFAPDPGWANL